MMPVHQNRLTPDRLWKCMSISLARTADTPLIAAAAGFDCSNVDLEHSAVSIETASMLSIVASGAGLIPFVRLPRNDPETIARLLDSGTHGIIVSHVHDAKEAARVVDACRFAPWGQRPPIASNPVNRYGTGTWEEIAAECNAATVVAVMIENAEAVDNVGDIAAVPGLDLLIIGAWDLSASLGVPMQFENPAFRSAVTKAASGCMSEGKILGLAGISDFRLLAEFVAIGVRFVSAGTDQIFLREAAFARAAKLRSIDVQPMGGLKP